jgi:hypothetical protein
MVPAEEGSNTPPPINAVKIIDFDNALTVWWASKAGNEKSLRTTKQLLSFWIRHPQYNDKLFDYFFRGHDRSWNRYDPSGFYFKVKNILESWEVDEQERANSVL